MRTILVLDSNIIDKCFYLKMNKEFFQQLGCDIQIPTHVQTEVKNSNKEHLITTMNELNSQTIGFFGFRHQPNARGFGEGVFFTNDDKEFIFDKKDNHIEDRFIIQLAKIHNAIFVSADKRAIAKSEEHKVKAILFEDEWSSEDFKKAFLQKMFV